MLMPLLQAIWSLVSAIPAFVPLALLPGEAWFVARRGRLWLPACQIGRWSAVSLLVFGGLDCALLSALPRLGLSFGPIGLSLLGISAGRLLLALLWLWLWQASGIRWPRLGTAQGLVLGSALLWLLNLGILVAEADGFYVEPFTLTVSEVAITGPVGWPGRPLRVVQLSDLHLERTTRRESETLQRVAALEPDLIVLTGDYLSTSYLNDPVAHRDAREFLSQLHAPYGIYAITARHVDTPEAMAAMFGDLDVVVLRDEVQKLSVEGTDLYLVGLSYLDRQRDAATLSALMEQVPAEAYSLLLYHTPDLATVASQEGVDLYLAGHTHGGQIRLPFVGALYTASATGKRYEQGRYLVGDTVLYVSRGLGMEGMGAPRARFLCPPEIVLVELGNSDGR